MHIVLLCGFLLLLGFAVGVWLAPIVRGDYASYKAYVEEKLKAVEQSAKDKINGAAKKL